MEVWRGEDEEISKKSSTSKGKTNPTMRAIPAISIFAVIVAVVGVKTLALCLTGTKPAFVTSRSCRSSAHTPRVEKCPLTFVCARMLYGVSANDIFTSDNGMSATVKILPVSTWWAHVHASQASFSVPMVQFLEQSNRNSYTILSNKHTNCLSIST